MRESWFPGIDDERLALDLVEVLARQLVLVLEAERRQIAGADHDVGLQLVDLGDRALEQVRLEVLLAAMQIGEVRDRERSPAPSAWPQCRRGFEGCPSDVASLAGVREVPRFQARQDDDGGPEHVFQAYRGAEPPRFANRIELECAKILDFYGDPVGVRAAPRSCSSATSDGRVTSAFTPDFYLPEQDLYIEVTVMKQSLVTRKNRKLRELRELYPDVKVKLFYRRDLERLAQRYRLKLAS